MSAAAVIARYTVVEARRNRLVWLVVGFVVIGFGLAEFVGDVAITERLRFQSGFYAALLRGCAMLTVTLFVITSTMREQNDKGLELVLSLPVARASYLAGKLAGYSAIAIATAALCAAALLVYAPAGPVAVWGASLAMELLIVTAFALLCLFTFSQVTWAASTVIGFYVLARSIAAFQLMASGPLAFGDSLSQRGIRATVEAIAFLLPDLDRFTRSEWVMDQAGSLADLGPVVMQTAIYLALLAAAALFDLYRKAL